MNPNDIIQPVVVAVLLGAGVLFSVSIWHLSRTLGARIRRWGESPPSGGGRAELQEAQAVALGEVDALRRELGELAERLDFVERLLAKERDAARLVPPRSER